MHVKQLYVHFSFFFVHELATIENACRLGGRISMKKALLNHMLGCLFVFIENVN